MLGSLTISKIEAAVGKHFNIFAAQTFYLNRLLFLALFFLLSSVTTLAQVIQDSVDASITDSALLNNSAIQKDTFLLMPVSDSVSKMPKKDTGWVINPSEPFFNQKLSWMLLIRHPYFGFSAPSTSIRSDTRHVNGKEFLFYFLVLLLIIYAILRRAFPKYYKDLIRLFFRTSIKQSQIREQMMENPLPSLLWNGFFVVSGGLYIAFLIQYFKINPVDNFWLILLFGTMGLTGIYLIKFLGLKISGWLFNMNEASNTYIFIVFIINKMIGILLIPFLILLAFTSGGLYSIGLNLSWYLIAGLMCYRIILTFGVVRNQVKVNLFHFFLYICAFEIAPLLLIYKGLLLLFRITT